MSSLPYAPARNGTISIVLKHKALILPSPPRRFIERSVPFGGLLLKSLYITEEAFC